MSERKLENATRQLVNHKQQMVSIQSVLSKSTEEVKYVDFLPVSSSHSMISVGDLEIPITGKNMRLLTRMRHEEKEELGVNNQGISQTL